MALTKTWLHDNIAPFVLIRYHVVRIDRKCREEAGGRRVAVILADESQLDGVKDFAIFIPTVCLYASAETEIA